MTVFYIKYIIIPFRATGTDLDMKLMFSCPGWSSFQTNLS